MAAAAAIAFAPLAVPAQHFQANIPPVAAANIQLAVSPADIDALVANLQAVLGNNTAAVTEAAGAPGQTLIGVVSNIVDLIGVTFTGLIDATDDPTLAASLTILKTLSVDAYAMLHENLGLINPVITTTTAQVGELVTTALTGSLQNALVAVLNLATNPLDLGSYAGLLNAGVASGQLLAGNGLQTVQRLGDGGFDIAGIALKEVTFQFNNAVTRLGDLITQLGDASGNAVVQAVVGAVKGLVITPALAVVNLGSGVAKTVLTSANTGFDQLVGGATSIVGATATPLQTAVTAPDASGNLDAARLRISERQTASLTIDSTKTSPPSDDVTPAKDASTGSLGLPPATLSLTKNKATQSQRRR
jgi:hypothetical protein